MSHESNFPHGVKTTDLSATTINASNYINSYYIHKRGYDRLHPDLMGDVTYDAATRTCSISPKTGQDSFEFFADGEKFIKTTTQTITHPDNTNTYVFYFGSDGELGYTTKSVLIGDVFEIVAITSIIYYNSITKLAPVVARDEQHGQLMDGSTHWNMHLSVGLRYARKGILAVGFTDASSTYTKIESGILMDEDIQLNIEEITAMPFMYLEGDIALEGGWKETAPDLNIGYIHDTDTYISINTHTGTVYGLTESTSSTDYVIYLVLATNDLDNPYKKIVGQNAYSNRSTAREALATEVVGVELLGLPGAEMKFIYAYIAKRNGDLEDDGDGNALVDLRMIYDYNNL